jgi:hypothetical protein
MRDSKIFCQPLASWLFSTHGINKKIVAKHKEGRKGVRAGHAQALDVMSLFTLCSSVSGRSLVEWQDQRTTNASDACRQPYLLEVLSKTTDKEKVANAVLNGTGPWLLRDAFAAWSKDAGPLAKGYAGPAAPDGRRMFTHPFGKWCVPSLHS